MNSRFRTTSTGAQVERIAAETHVIYNPQTREASIVFQGDEFLVGESGDVGDQLASRETLTALLSEIGEVTVDAGRDPITGVLLDSVSVLGIGNLIRAVYDRLHNDRAGGDQ